MARGPVAPIHQAEHDAEYQGYVRANKFVALSICSIVIAMVRNLTALLC